MPSKRFQTVPEMFMHTTLSWIAAEECRCVGDDDMCATCSAVLALEIFDRVSESREKRSQKGRTDDA